MERNARTVAIAFLCVLAVSLGAATLANPQTPQGVGESDRGGAGEGSAGAGQNEGDSGGAGSGEPAQRQGLERPQLGTLCVPFLASPTFVLGAVLAVGLLWWVMARRENKLVASAMLVVVLTMFVPFWLVLTACGSSDQLRPPGGDVARTAQGLEDAVGGGARNAADAVSSPPVLLASLLLVAAVLAVVVFRASGDDAPRSDRPRIVQPGDTPDDEETLAAVGEAAGEAADRIDASADVDNEVYRAWHEMTTHLDVENPASSTPGEFAAAARAAGMDESNVESLTELFRDVRYGGEPVTEGREQRAVDALRGIESRYAR